MSSRLALGPDSQGVLSEPGTRRPRAWLGPASRSRDGRADIDAPAVERNHGRDSSRSRNVRDGSLPRARWYASPARPSARARPGVPRAWLEHLAAKLRKAAQVLQADPLEVASRGACVVAYPPTHASEREHRSPRTRRVALRLGSCRFASETRLATCRQLVRRAPQASRPVSLRNLPTAASDLSR
jgi:hypothetical protein